MHLVVRRQPYRRVYTYLHSFLSEATIKGRNAFRGRILFFFPLDILPLIPIDVDSLLLCESTSPRRPLFLECFPVAIRRVFHSSPSSAHLSQAAIS